MKKLFISCPMNGRTDENIKKSREQMHKIAEIMFDQPLEVIDSFFEGEAPESNNVAIEYLSRSIHKLAEADYFIGIRGSYEWSDCSIEDDITHRYGIPSVYVDWKILMPDAVEIMRKREEDGRVCCKAPTFD